LIDAVLKKVHAFVTADDLLLSENDTVLSIMKPAAIATDDWLSIIHTSVT